MGSSRQYRGTPAEAMAIIMSAPGPPPNVVAMVTSGWILVGRAQWHRLPCVATCALSLIYKPNVQYIVIIHSTVWPSAPRQQALTFVSNTHVRTHVGIPTWVHLSLMNVSTSAGKRKSWFSEALISSCAPSAFSLNWAAKSSSSLVPPSTHTVLQAKYRASASENQLFMKVGNAIRIQICLKSLSFAV